MELWKKDRVMIARPDGTPLPCSAPGSVSPSSVARAVRKDKKSTQNRVPGAPCIAGYAASCIFFQLPSRPEPPWRLQPSLILGRLRARRPIALRSRDHRGLGRDACSRTRLFQTSRSRYTKAKNPRDSRHCSFCKLALFQRTHSSTSLPAASVLTDQAIQLSGQPWPPCGTAPDSPRQSCASAAAARWRLGSPRRRRSGRWSCGCSAEGCGRAAA